MNKYLEKIAMTLSRGEAASVFGLGAATGVGVGGAVVGHVKDKKNKEDRRKYLLAGTALGAGYARAHPEAFSTPAIQSK